MRRDDTHTTTEADARRWEELHAEWEPPRGACGGSYYPEPEPPAEPAEDEDEEDAEW